MIVARQVFHDLLVGRRQLQAAAVGELADVLVCVAELANHYQVDLQTACRAKLADLAERVPVWAQDLGPALEAARARMYG